MWEARRGRAVGIVEGALAAQVVTALGALEPALPVLIFAHVAIRTEFISTTSYNRSPNRQQANELQTRGDDHRIISNANLSKIVIGFSYKFNVSPTLIRTFQKIDPVLKPKFAAKFTAIITLMQTSRH